MASTGDSVPSPVGELPPCAAQCLTLAFTVDDCEFLDLQCQCSRKNTLKVMSTCVINNCTWTDAVTLSYAAANTCNLPHNNHHTSMMAAVVGSIVAVYMIVGLRVISRICTVRRFWWDDWFHILSAVLQGPLSAFAILCVNGGMGYHFYDIDFSSTTEASNLAFWYYMCQIFWTLVIYLFKMSILFLYIRIFPNRVFYQCTVTTMVLVTVSITILVPMTIWQCNPMHVIWDLHRKNAQCISQTGVAYANAAVNIATEIAILILPLPLLYKLQVSRSTKVGLFTLFGCGILVIGIASARVPTMAHITAVDDPTYLNNGVFYWICAETIAGSVCCAAPAVWPLFLKLKQACFRERKEIPGGYRMNSFWHSSKSKYQMGSGDPITESCIHCWSQPPT